MNIFSPTTFSYMDRIVTPCYNLTITAVKISVQMRFMMTLTIRDAVSAGNSCTVFQVFSREEVSSHFPAFLFTLPSYCCRTVWLTSLKLCVKFLFTLSSSRTSVLLCMDTETWQAYTYQNIGINIYLNLILDWIVTRSGRSMKAPLFFSKHSTYICYGYVLIRPSCCKQRQAVSWYNRKTVYLTHMSVLS
jgi:hypothetical protein